MARSAGFSLVEVLTALAVLALATGAILLTAPAASPSVSREADILAARLQAARDAALIGNRAVAVTFDEAGYETRVRHRFGWRPPEGGRDFHAWAEDTSVSVGDGRLPQTLVFDPLGLSDPGEVTLFRDGRAARVRLDGAGNIERGDDGAR
jgi:general secretion pathway protein H